MKRMTRAFPAACLAVLAILGLVLPTTAARADDGTKKAKAMDCAISYAEAENAEEAAAKIISDWGRIAKQRRSMRLVEAYGLDVNFVQGPALMALSEGNSAIESGNPALEQIAVYELAECDRLYGFTPVHALTGWQEFSTAPTPERQISDFACAAAYWLHGAANVGDRQAALERSEFATGLHYMDNPSEDPAAIGQQVIRAGKERGQRIQQGQESVEEFAADLSACEARYGFAQAGGQ